MQSKLHQRQMIVSWKDQEVFMATQVLNRFALTIRNGSLLRYKRVFETLFAVIVIVLVAAFSQVLVIL